MEKDSLIVDGFVFSSHKEAQIALKEQDNVEAIRKRIQGADGKTIYELYCKLIQREMFHTVIGYGFLYEMRYQLVQKFGYRQQELPDVQLPKRMEYDKVSHLNQNKMESKIEQLLVIKSRMTITIVALVFVIVGMFIIAAVNPNVGYVNVEHKILNKYSAWQEDLERREAALKEKESQQNEDSSE